MDGNPLIPDSLKDSTKSEVLLVAPSICRHSPQIDTFTVFQTRFSLEHILVLDGMIGDGRMTPPGSILLGTQFNRVRVGTYNLSLF